MLINNTFRTLKTAQRAIIRNARRRALERKESTDEEEEEERGEKEKEEEEEEEEGDMVNSSSQTLVSELEMEETEEEGSQTVIPDSVTLALAILANRLSFCFNQSIKKRKGNQRWPF